MTEKTETFEYAPKPPAQSERKERAEDIVFDEAEEFQQGQQQELARKADGLADMFEDAEGLVPEETAALKANAEAMESLVAGVDIHAKTMIRQSAVPEVTPESKTMIAAPASEIRMEGNAQERERTTAEFRERAQSVSTAVMASLERRLTEARENGDQERVASLERSMRREQERREQERDLLEGEVLATEKLDSKSVNEVFVAQVGERMAAYKPRSLEHVGAVSVYAVEAQTGYAREWLMTQVDRALGTDVVPTTVLREGKEGIGSFQHWEVSDKEKSLDWSVHAQPAGLEAIALLDRVSNNGDRHSKNLLVGADGKAWAIDNGLAFLERDKAAYASHVQDTIERETAEYAKAFARIDSSDELAPEKKADLRGKLQKNQEDVQRAMRRRMEYGMLNSAPLADLFRKAGSLERPLPLSEALAKNVDAYLADPAAQDALRECFRAAFGTAGGDKQFEAFQASVAAVREGGFEPYTRFGSLRKTSDGTDLLPSSEAAPGPQGVSPEATGPPEDSLPTASLRPKP